MSSQRGTSTLYTHVQFTLWITVHVSVHVPMYHRDAQIGDEWEETQHQVYCLALKLLSEILQVCVTPLEGWAANAVTHFFYFYSNPSWLYFHLSPTCMCIIYQHWKCRRQSRGHLSLRAPLLTLWACEIENTRLAQKHHRQPSHQKLY